jgi:hypothetical protein
VLPGDRTPLQAAMLESAHLAPCGSEGYGFESLRARNTFPIDFAYGASDVMPIGSGPSDRRRRWCFATIEPFAPVVWLLIRKARRDS